MNVFTYGSLMFPEVWMRVVGKEYKKVGGVVTGYKRKRVKNQTYPGLIPGKPSDVVNGIVYMDVSYLHLEVLDRFEADTYERTLLACEMEKSGERLWAFTYVFKLKYAHLLEDVPWDPEYFLTKGMTRFINEYEGFKKGG